MNAMDLHFQRSYSYKGGRGNPSLTLRGPLPAACPSSSRLSSSLFPSALSLPSGSAPSAASAAPNLKDVSLDFSAYRTGKTFQLLLLCRLARTVCIHRIWPYIWSFPCPKYHTYTVYICICIYRIYICIYTMVLANPSYHAPVPQTERNKGRQRS